MYYNRRQCFFIPNLLLTMPEAVGEYHPSRRYSPRGKTQEFKRDLSPPQNLLKTLAAP